MPMALLIQHSIATALSVPRVSPSSDFGYAAALQPDGKILVAGASYNGSGYDFSVVRYNTDGSLDTSFDGDGVVTTVVGSNSSFAHGITLQADGKILVSGYAISGSTNDYAVVRYNADGSLDTSFDGDGIATVAVGTSADYGREVAVQSDGKIIIVGNSNNGSDEDIGVIRLNSDGSLDTSFGLQTTLDGAPVFSEGGAAVVLDADVDVSDAELDALNGGAGNYDGSILTIVRNGGANADDVFSFNDGNGITLVGNDLIKNGQPIATFDITTTPGELVITFVDDSGEIPTSADVDNILHQITYANSSGTPPASVTLDWTFDDGNVGAQGSGGALQAVGSTTVTILPANNPPVLSNGGTAGTLEQSGSVVPFSSATVTDVDSTDFDGGTLTLTATIGADPTDTLHVATFGGVTTTGSNVYVSGVLVGTFTGGTSGTPLVITFNTDAHAGARPVSLPGPGPQERYGQSLFGPPHT